MPSDLFELLPEIGPRVLPPWVLTASVTGGAVATLLVLLVVVTGSTLGPDRIRRSNASCLAGRRRHRHVLR